MVITSLIVNARPSTNTRTLTLVQPSLRYRIDPDGSFRAEGSTALVGVLLLTPIILVGVWALTVRSGGVWVFAALFALGVLPIALSALVRRVTIAIDRLQVRYERKGLTTLRSIAPRSALLAVSLRRRVFQAESRFVVYQAELCFADAGLPSRVKVFESLDLSKASAVAEQLSSALSCALKQENHS
jgi:hypothetical protein